MERQAVSSSMMQSIGYDVETGVLEIQFRDSSVWQYFDFPAVMWWEFQGCESHGKYWHANIKKAFRESRVG